MVWKDNGKVTEGACKRKARIRERPEGKEKERKDNE
jgi:hypothetical protein